MSFQPIIPASGYAGWRFLQRTIDTQKVAFVESVPIKRAAEYFRENIGSIRTAQDLVDNRRLLEVALGAFGLDDDINSKFFIRKILEDGTTDPKALSSRIADKRYAALSRAFGFGDIGIPRTGLTKFPSEIIDKYEARQFEKAVGVQDENMRLALNLSSGLKELLDLGGSERSQWFGMMGNKPLRSVFETAMGFPPSFGRIDIDQQLQQFRSRARSVFGTDKLADFLDLQMQEKMVRLYLIRSDPVASSSSAGSVALTLLQSASVGWRR